MLTATIIYLIVYLIILYFICKGLKLEDKFIIWVGETLAFLLGYPFYIGFLFSINLV